MNIVEQIAEFTLNTQGLINNLRAENDALLKEVARLDKLRIELESKQPKEKEEK